MSKHLCATCVDDFAICTGNPIFAIDISKHYALSGADADTVIKCDGYKVASHNWWAKVEIARAERIRERIVHFRRALLAACGGDKQKMIDLLRNDADEKE